MSQQTACRDIRNKKRLTWVVLALCSSLLHDSNGKDGLLLPAIDNGLFLYSIFTRLIMYTLLATGTHLALPQSCSCLLLRKLIVLTADVRAGRLCVITLEHSARLLACDRAWGAAVAGNTTYSCHQWHRIPVWGCCIYHVGC